MSCFLLDVLIKIVYNDIMKITTNVPQIPFTANPIRIQANDNKHVPYLYNKVLDLIQHEPFKTGATFMNGSPGEIHIPTPPKGLKERLTELGVKFTELVKKQT